jgi:hypothetical protein
VNQPSSRPRDRAPDFVWSAALVVTSVIGGLAAADVTNESTVWAVVISLVVAAIGVFALYRGLLDNLPQAHGQHAGVPAGQGPRAGQRLPAGPVYPGAARAFPAPPEGALDDRPAAQQEPVRPGLVRVVQSGGAWWEGHAPPRPAGPAARSAGPRPVDLSQFLGQALIAQCPHCGSFHVDFKDQTEPWAFWCADCRRQWTWQPGTPWPAIAVRPNARGRVHPPRA